MTKRLEILEGSLVKKKAAFDQSIEAHFADVKRANGQPMNDKRNGHATLNRWEKQSDALRNKQEGIEKTERAIEREKDRILDAENALAVMPPEIVSLVDAGTLIQWRKHPNTFFVDGVDKARIQFKGGKLYHKFTKSITDKEQWAIFRDVVNGLNKALKKTA